MNTAYDTRYKGSTPVKYRDWVTLLDEGEPVCKACVKDVLAEQFTVIVDNHTKFLFYKDKGLTWRPL